MVGIARFELAALCSQGRCATGLRYIPRPFFQDKNDYIIYTKTCQHFFSKKRLTVFLNDAIIIYVLRERRRNIAQSGSASALGAGGRKFESCYSDHLNAGIAQLVERQPSKLNVASSTLVSRSKTVSVAQLDRATPF